MLSFYNKTFLTRAYEVLAVCIDFFDIINKYTITIEIRLFRKIYPNPLLFKTIKTFRRTTDKSIRSTIDIFQTASTRTKR